MIVVTGAAGFIGSVLTGKLNHAGIENLIVVDDFSDPIKNKNLVGKKFISPIERDDFFRWFDEHPDEITFVIHIGARTDTTEFNKDIFDILNLNYSKQVWLRCTEHQIPLIYASSAATYGMGEHGYVDDHSVVNRLKPLNPYGESKNDFDRWVLSQENQPPFWAGLKFFNVYGPNEYHKGRMASVIFHSYNQIRDSKQVKLFRSHKPEYLDGEQLRDFIYVKDVVDVIYFLMQNKPQSGIYNLGTGNARTFLDLVNAVFAATGIMPKIKFIDTPADIREKYQYFTEARMDKLRSVGYYYQFTSLEEGVRDYVKNYLAHDQYY